MNKKHRKLVAQFIEWRHVFLVSSDELEAWRLCFRRLANFERHLPPKMRKLPQIMFQGSM